MTGESDECVKDIPDNCLQKLQELIEDEKPGDEKDRTHHSIPSPLLMSGTQIQTGEGWFLIIVVGKNSAMGIINAKIQQKGAEMTPLQEKLEAIAQAKPITIVTYHMSSDFYATPWLQRVNDPSDPRSLRIYRSVQT